MENWNNKSIQSVFDCFLIILKKVCCKKTLLTMRVPNNHVHKIILPCWKIINKFMDI